MHSTTVLSTLRVAVRRAAADMRYTRFWLPLIALLLLSVTAFYGIVCTSVAENERVNAAALAYLDSISGGSPSERQMWCVAEAVLLGLVLTFIAFSARVATHAWHLKVQEATASQTGDDRVR